MQRDNLGRFVKNSKTLTVRFDPTALLGKTLSNNYCEAAVLKGLTFYMAGHKITIFAGPYSLRPTFLPGICLAKEYDDKPAEVFLPIRDFSVPTVAEMKQGLIKIVQLLLCHGDVYMGCQGGLGRTGLVLACLFKTIGFDNPIETIRKCYEAHAVETAEQKNFVAKFDPTDLRVIFQLLSLDDLSGKK